MRHGSTIAKAIPYALWVGDPVHDTRVCNNKGSTGKQRPGHREERLSEQRAFCKPRARLARRNAQARVAAEAELSAAKL